VNIEGASQQMSAGTSSAARTGVTVLMDLLVAVAVVSLAHLVIRFFGAFATASWGASLVRLTRYAVLPLGISDIATPYAGAFDGNAAVTVLVLLGIEWALGLVRRNV